MHQTISEYLCIFCPLYYVFHLILQCKEILRLCGDEHLILL